ncbi:site-specific integrase [Sphingobium phenoxybenzoativorans]|uniref:Site-specific integrase n=1 Tax=Sphingobium phenoxybenzoativorans TaxID=1592790 RepID=A0A975Q042_9SPHN|nr:site-specific integrase [Sphingobium phenoxybenzoativorans]QUT04003.1 site-specific integrase [Sphingobium phenoxybenzoativorans]
MGRIVTAYITALEDDGKPSVPRRKDAWKAMKGFWENVMPAVIDKPMAKAYRATRKVADATARYELMLLSTALQWAIDNKDVTKILSRPTIWLPPQPERKTRHLTRKQFDRFLNAIVAPHAKLYAMIGIHTMARPSAILELTWDRVNFMRGLIDFNPAGRNQTVKRRPIVPISDDLMPVLQTAYKSRTSVNVIERGGEPIASIKKAFQAASERSNVHATPYTLRHTGAVWAAEGGAPMTQLAQFMGHDDDRTTQKHYARFSPDFLRDVANAVTRKPVQKRGSI